MDEFLHSTNNSHLHSLDGIVWCLFPSYQNLMIAITRYVDNISEFYGQRECHGLMPWQTHKELHDQNGTYRVSGLDIDLSSILINPDNNLATNDGNRPDMNIGVIKDEDLSTTIPQWLSTSKYTILYFNSNGEAIFDVISLDIYKQLGNVLQYNPFGQGLKPMTNRRYINLWCYHTPVTSDGSSQKYRNVWLVGQRMYDSISSAQNEDPRLNNFGNITDQIVEQIPYAVVTMYYTTSISSASVFGRCKIASDIRYLTGNKVSLVSSTATSVSHNSTTDRDSVGNHTKLAPMIDSTTALQITKSDGVSVVFDVDTLNNRVGIGTISPSSKLQVVGLLNFADNSTALSNGLTVGAFYHSNGILKVVI